MSKLRHPQKCFVCNRNRGTLTAAPVHKLPKDLLSRIQWCANLDLDPSTISSDTESIGVCGRHFLPTCYQSLHNLLDYHVLKVNAVPTLKDAFEWNKIFELFDSFYESPPDIDYKILRQSESCDPTPLPYHEHDYAAPSRGKSCVRKTFKKEGSSAASKRKADTSRLPVTQSPLVDAHPLLTGIGKNLVTTNDACQGNDLMKSKFIVYGSSFLELFRKCPRNDCTGLVVFNQVIRLSIYDMTWCCTNGHIGSLDNEKYTEKIVSLISNHRHSRQFAEVEKCMELRLRRR